MNSINTNVYIVWNHYQSQKIFNYRNQRVFIQKLIKLLRNLNIIHQSSKCIKSIYCVSNNCSINNHTKFRKCQAFIFKMSIYNIVSIVKRLIIIWHVKKIYTYYINVLKIIMNRRKCNTNVLINNEIWKRFETFESNLMISNKFRIYAYCNYWIFIYYRSCSLNYIHIHVILMKQW